MKLQDAIIELMTAMKEAEKETGGEGDQETRDGGEYERVSG